jgi:hypothetical protein
MLRCNPASSAFRRIRLVGPTAGDLTEEVLGLGFGLGSTDDVLDFRLKKNNLEELENYLTPRLVTYLRNNILSIEMSNMS